MNVEDLKAQLGEWGPITTILLLLTTIVAVAGAVVSITDPHTLDFNQYLSKMQGFAIALAGLGLGHGIKKGLERQTIAPDALAAGPITLVPAGTFTGTQPTEDEVLAAGEPHPDEELGAAAELALPTTPDIAR